MENTAPAKRYVEHYDNHEACLKNKQRRVDEESFTKKHHHVVFVDAAARMGCHDLLQNVILFNFWNFTAMAEIRHGCFENHNDRRMKHI